MFYSCQATNLAGTGQQATPVTVRHTGTKTFFGGKTIFLLNLLIWTRTDMLSHVKTQCENTKCMRKKSYLSSWDVTIKQENMTTHWWAHHVLSFQLQHRDLTLMWDCFSDAISRGCSLSNRQLLSQRGLLRLLQVHRGAGLQVCTLDSQNSPDDTAADS